MKVHVFLKTPLFASTLPGEKKIDRGILQIRGELERAEDGCLHLEDLVFGDGDGKERQAPFDKLSLPLHKVDFYVPADQVE